MRKTGGKTKEAVKESSFKNPRLLGSARLRQKLEAFLHPVAPRWSHTFPRSHRLSYCFHPSHPAWTGCYFICTSGDAVTDDKMQIGWQKSFEPRPAFSGSIFHSRNGHRKEYSKGSSSCLTYPYLYMSACLPRKKSLLQKDMKTAHIFLTSLLEYNCFTMLC